MLGGVLGVLDGVLMGLRGYCQTVVGRTVGYGGCDYTRTLSVTRDLYLNGAQALLRAVHARRTRFRTFICAGVAPS
jgi:hypothetical protein